MSARRRVEMIAAKRAQPPSLNAGPIIMSCSCRIKQSLACPDPKQEMLRFSERPLAYPHSWWKSAGLLGSCAGQVVLTANARAPESDTDKHRESLRYRGYGPGSRVYRPPESPVEKEHQTSNIKQQSNQNPLFTIQELPLSSSRHAFLFPRQDHRRA